MAIDPDRLMALRETVEASYDQQAAKLYALSVGFGADPMAGADLAYLDLSPAMQISPAFASLFPLRSIFAKCGIERPHLALHKAQRLVAYRAFPPSAALHIDCAIAGVYDLGAERGALLEIEGVARLKGDDAPLARVTIVSQCRGDGGFGGAPPPPRREAMPTTAPDLVVRCPTLAAQALWYSLNGDTNPIHILPQAAAKAGFDRPILHGLCTYGIAARAIITGCLEGHAAALRTLDASFTTVVYPGETLSVEIWRDGAYRVRSEDRALVVVDHGRWSAQPDG
jgi:acyl dehydratase